MHRVERLGHGDYPVAGRRDIESHINLGLRHSKSTCSEARVQDLGNVHRCSIWSDNARADHTPVLFCSNIWPYLGQLVDILDAYGPDQRSEMYSLCLG